MMSSYFSFCSFQRYVTGREAATRQSWSDVMFDRVTDY